MTVPIGWKKVQIRNLLKSAEAGVSVNGYDKFCGLNEFGVLKVSAVSGGTFDPSEAKCIRDDEIHRAKLNPKKDHIVFSRANTPELVGASAYIHETYPNLYLSDKLWLLSPKDAEIVNMRWLAFLLSSPFMRNRLGQLATGTSSSMKNISKEALLNLEVILPSINQQKAIANILATWDEAIEKVERLIELLKQRKLSFSLYFYSKLKDCEMMPLYKMASVTTGQSAPQNPEDFGTSGIPFIRVSSLKGLIDGNTYGIEFLNKEIAIKNKMKAFPPNTLVFAKSGMSAKLDRIYLLRETSYLVSHLAAITSNDKTDPNYLKFWFEINPPSRLVQGDGFPSIKTSEIASILIKCPNLKVQKEIGGKLQIIEQEIDLTTKYLEKIRAQKQDLMQKLLTGNWRVTFKDEK